MGPARLRFAPGLAWLVAGGLALSGCPSQTSGDDDDDAIGDDDTGGGDDDSGEWEVVFEDDFERADGPLGDAYEVMVYQGSEIAEIRDGEAFVDATYFAIRFVDPVDDEVIRATVTARYELVDNGVEDALIALVVRYAEDPGGDYPSYGAFLDATSDEIALQRTVVSGTDGQVTLVLGEPISYALAPDTGYRIALTAAGSNIQARFVDIGTELEQTMFLEDTSPLTTGQVGIHGNLPGDVVVTLDDLLIERRVP